MASFHGILLLIMLMMFSLIPIVNLVGSENDKVVKTSEEIKEEIRIFFEDFLKNYGPQQLINKIEADVEKVLSRSLNNVKQIDQSEAERKFSKLVEITNKLKQNSKMVVLNGKADESSSGGNQHESSNLLYYKRHSDANLDFDSLIKKIWLHVHSDGFKELNEKIIKHRDSIRKQLEHFLVGAPTFEQIHQIILRVMADKIMKRQLKSVLKKPELQTKKNDNKQLGKKILENIIESLKMGKKSAASANEELLKKLSEAEYSSYKQMLEDLKLIAKDEYPVEFLTNLRKFEKIFEQKEFKEFVRINAVRNFVQIFVRTIEKGIERAVNDEAKEKQYKQTHINLLLNFFSRQVIQMLGVEFVEKKNLGYYNFAFIKELLKPSDSETGPIKEYMSREIYQLVNDRFPLLDHVRQCLRYINVNNDGYHLYDLALSLKWLLPEQMVDAKKAKKFEKDLSVQVILDILQMLAFYNRLEQYYAQTGKEIYENAIEGKESLKLEIKQAVSQIHKIAMKLSSESLGGYLHEEFTKVYDQKMEDKKDIELQKTGKHKAKKTAGIGSSGNGHHFPGQASGNEANEQNYSINTGILKQTGSTSSKFHPDEQESPVGSDEDEADYSIILKKTDPINTSSKFHPESVGEAVKDKQSAGGNGNDGSSIHDEFDYGESYWSAPLDFPHNIGIGESLKLSEYGESDWSDQGS